MSAARGRSRGVSVKQPETPHTPVSGLPTIYASDLPSQARDTLGLIRAGGPFPYRQDETFFNREGFLPAQPRGYYREYTVETRGSADRGARRIVAGRSGDRVVVRGPDPAHPSDRRSSRD